MIRTSAISRRLARVSPRRPGGMGPTFRSIASAGLRSGVLIAIAMLLIFVLLPAVLGAQAAAAL